jgi:hypothetical protein
LIGSKSFPRIPRLGLIKALPQNVKIRDELSEKIGVNF